VYDYINYFINLNIYFMNKKFLTACGLGAFALAVGMNLNHAIGNYGIVDNSLDVNVVAQNNSSSGNGSNSGNGSGNGGSSSNPGGSSSNPGGGSTNGENKPCEEEDNNANGRNIYLYCDKAGHPKSCKLYKHVDANGSVEWSDKSKLEGSYKYTGISVDGVKELCPKKGKGCTVYSCHQTANTTGGGQN
jgi:hypothetical protein